MQEVAEVQSVTEPGQPLPIAKEPATLYPLAAGIVIAVGSWFLLRELAGLLRPLLLAVFLCYVILPGHMFLKRWLPSLISIFVLAGATAGILYLLSLMVYSSAVELHEELPRLIERARAIGRDAEQFWAEHAPAWLASLKTDAIDARTDMSKRLRDVVDLVANGAAAALGEGLVVGFYLLFLLLEVSKFPQRVRRSFSEYRAEQILDVVARINAAAATYLKLKVKASLFLAVPVTIVLWAFGVKFAFMWGVLTFVANFIPYIGSIVACTLPILLAFLQLDLGWQPCAVAILLVSIHLLTANIIEPAMTGRTVGLSPLVVLVALAFWGQCWGLIGMLLAVPLTMTLKIVLENVAITRPVARLLGEE
jgi:AI-2 transport protein TqsA